MDKGQELKVCTNDKCGERMFNLRGGWLCEVCDCVENPEKSAENG